MNPNRASATAVLIAAATVMRGDTRGPGRAPAGAVAWCERCLSTTRRHRLLRRSVRSVIGRAVWRAVEWIALRGVVSHWMRRKRTIDHLVRQAAADGFTQLVVIGAGLDSLAFRLGGERLFTSILSVDHPATMSLVRSSLADTEKVVDQAAVGRGVELVSLDLARQDIAAALTSSASFDAECPTLFVIEGVLMYFPESMVASVLGSLASLKNRRLRLIASWMVAEPGKPIGFARQSRCVPAWLRRRDEPMLWGSTADAMPAFLNGLGWRGASLVDLAGHPSEPAEARGLRSEMLLVAERG